MKIGDTLYQCCGDDHPCIYTAVFCGRKRVDGGTYYLVQIDRHQTLRATHLWFTSESAALAAWIDQAKSRLRIKRDQLEDSRRALCRFAETIAMWEQKLKGKNARSTRHPRKRRPHSKA